MTTLNRRIAGYIHDLRYEDIPPGVIEQAKHHLVHHLGLALSGRRTAEGEQAVRMARLLNPHGGDCVVIGSDLRAGALDAAFANTSLMRAEGLDDVLFPVGVHAGLVTIPVALALAEAGALTGRQLLTAVVAGYDVIGKLGAGTWAWSANTPRRPTMAFGPFGAATVAAKLLELDVPRAAQALAYAAHCAMGLAEGALVTHYYALVARNGMLGAMLAREGGQSAPTVLEGRFGFYRTFFGGMPPGLPQALDSLGTVFEIENATTKRYPGTALNIVPIELMIELVREHRLTPDQVSQIELTLPVERANFAEGHATGPFPDRAAATSSAVFQVAIALLDGGLDLARYDQLDNPAIREIVSRISVALVPDRPIRYAQLQITTTDGRRLARERASHNFSGTDWLPWLIQRAAGTMGDDLLARVTELVDGLEDVKDVAELMRCLT